MTQNCPTLNFKELKKKLPIITISITPMLNQKKNKLKIIKNNLLNHFNNLSNNNIKINIYEKKN